VRDGVDKLDELRRYGSAEAKSLLSLLDDSEALAAILYTHDMMLPDEVKDCNLYYECSLLAAYYHLLLTMYVFAYSVLAYLLGEGR
jgi:hypothetical protein